MLEPAFMQLALIAAIATGASLSLMGVYLVIRRMVFIGLVLANAATMGSAIGQALGWTPELVSAGAAVATALILGLLKTPRRVPAESLMGWAYAAASSATVLILAQVAAADADTLHLLFGNLLAVSVSHAFGLVVIAVLIGFLHVFFSRSFLLVTFDPEAAEVAGVSTGLWSACLNLSIGIAAAAAVHEIGALLTFALLTLPAMSALLIATGIRTTFIVASVIGVVAAYIGLAVSFYLDLPAGPAAVAVLVVIVLLATGARTVFPRWRIREREALPSQK
jgi:ABC-type Mn2+/Zn2+ transport system permease subunit